jgi:hypothetical protein
MVYVKCDRSTVTFRRINDAIFRRRRSTSPFSTVTFVDSKVMYLYIDALKNDVCRPLYRKDGATPLRIHSYTIAAAKLK